MNERIRELYNQARNEVSIRDGILTPGELRDKFAELLIKDCIKCCVEVDDINKVYREGLFIEPCGISDCIETIKAHFGVEE